MIEEYICPINDRDTIKQQLHNANQIIKDMKTKLIERALADYRNNPYNYNDVKNGVRYDYLDDGCQILKYYDEQLIHFSKTTCKVIDNKEIVCSYEYKLLYTRRT